MPDLIGQTLRNRYQIQSSLGRGGMADVYLAWDGRRQVPVALKVLREDLAEDPEFLQRFQREAEALARLDHPNIVRFYSLERQGSLAFIVMDYVPGTTLRGRLSAGQPLPPAEVTAIMRQIAAALHYAHDSGYIHRDIKPGNIMLREDGTALLSDFGIARAAMAATMTAAPLGTPAYMSPEQILGRDLGPQSDIYSLGVCLYEMVTGRRPFTGEGTSGTSTMDKIRTQHLHSLPPDPRLYNPNLPPAAVAVILRALAKDPAQRWPDAISMARAWEAALRAPSATQPAAASAPGVTSPQPTPTRLGAAQAPPMNTPTAGQATPVPKGRPLLIFGGAFAIVVLVGLGAALAYQSLTKNNASVQATAAAVAQTSLAVQAQGTAIALQWATATANALASGSASSGDLAAQQANATAAAAKALEATAAQATALASGADKQTAIAQEAATATAAALEQASQTAAAATAAAEATAKSAAEATAVAQATADTSAKATADAAAQAEAATKEAADALAKQQTADAQAAANQAPGLVTGFENDISWRRGDQPYGNLTYSSEQVHSGAYAGRLDYAFPANSEGFVVFTARPAVAISGKPLGLSAWVYGDGSNFFLNAWLMDAAGELRQYTFGQVKHKGWAQMFAPFDDKAGWPNQSVGGPDNGMLDYPVSFYALVLDSVPHGPASQGTLYVDEIVATR